MVPISQNLNKYGVKTVSDFENPYYIHKDKLQQRVFYWDIWQIKIASVMKNVSVALNLQLLAVLQLYFFLLK